mgnify:CR=1 FL=1
MPVKVFAARRRIVAISVLEYLALYPVKYGHEVDGELKFVRNVDIALYDRLKRGYVVDYFSIQCGKLKKVVFNLGDIFVFLGSGILFGAELIKEIRGMLPEKTPVDSSRETM